MKKIQLLTVLIITVFLSFTFSCFHTTDCEDFRAHVRKTKKLHPNG
jgi:hypothetical protein